MKYACVYNGLLVVVDHVQNRWRSAGDEIPDDILVTVLRRQVQRRLTRLVDRQKRIALFVKLLQRREIANLRRSQYIVAILLKEIAAKSVNSRTQAEQPIAGTANRSKGNQLKAVMRNKRRLLENHE